MIKNEILKRCKKGSQKALLKNRLSRGKKHEKKHPKTPLFPPKTRTPKVRKMSKRAFSIAGPIARKEGDFYFCFCSLSKLSLLLPCFLSWSLPSRFFSLCNLCFVCLTGYWSVTEMVNPPQSNAVSIKQLSTPRTRCLELLLLFRFSSSSNWNCSLSLFPSWTSNWQSRSLSWLCFSRSSKYV